MEEQPIKRKRGQPRKRPTFVKSIRVDKNIKEFLESLENANVFVIQQIESTEEFLEFLKQKSEAEANQYNLFSGIEEK